MKINKEMLREIRGKSDAELWATVKSIAGRYGIRLPDGQPSPEVLSRLREALADGDKIDLGNAVEILNKYRRERK